MSTTETIHWQSDDDYLYIVFTLIYNSKAIISSVTMELSLVELPAGIISKTIPLSGSPIVLKHDFDNSNDISGEIQLQYNNTSKRASYILVWGNFSYQHPERKKRNHIKGGLVGFNYNHAGLHNKQLTADTDKKNQYANYNDNSNNASTKNQDPVDLLSKNKTIALASQSNWEDTISSGVDYKYFTISNKSYENLFPYIQLSPWHTIEQQTKNMAFININLPDSVLYQKLAILTKTKPLPELLKTVNNFILHDNNFVNNSGKLCHIMQLFPRLFDTIEYHHPVKLNKQQIEKILSCKIGELLIILQSQDYLQDLDKVWQSYLALNISINDQYSLYAQFAKTLIIHHYLSKHIISEKPTTEANLHHFIIVLPEEIFPLPYETEQTIENVPAKDSGSLLPSQVDSHNQVNIYALGYLHMIKRRLLRYEMAEIHHIENLLKGEKKVVKKRTLSRTANTTNSEHSDIHYKHHNRHDQTDRDLWKTLSNIAATQTETDYQNIDNNYGSPTVVNDGNTGLAGHLPDSNKQQEKNIHFAKNILNKANHHFSRKIQEKRYYSELNETEETICNYLDNTNGKENILGIYRWLNKVYQAQLITYGKRLMLEFIIEKPANHFISSQYNHFITAGIKPLSPASSNWKIHSWKNITQKNYTELAACYGINHLEPPPLLAKTISINLYDEQTRHISIPANYIARSATITPLLASASVSIHGLIGKHSFYFDSDDRCEKNISMNDNNENLSITMTTKFSKQEFFDSNVLVHYDQEFSEELKSSRSNRINVDIKCALNEQIFQEWQIQVYTIITQAYQQQINNYYEKLVSGQIKSHIAIQAVINESLKQSCKKALTKGLRHTPHTHTDPDHSTQISPATLPGKPHPTQSILFFENAIEWPEMTYSFIHHNDLTDYLTLCKTDSPDLLYEFLQAQYVRVLVPAVSEQLLKLLYYFNTGQLWSGKSQFIPCHANHLDIIHHLLFTNDQPDKCFEKEKNWEITIPTTMQILQKSMDLPEFNYDECL